MEMSEVRPGPHASAQGRYPPVLKIHKMEILLIAAGLVLLLIAAGWVYQRQGTVRDQRRFPPPGRMVEIGGRRVHLVEAGEGRPTVILEAGIAASCLNWTSVQARIARFTRVCSYDRSGLGWSDAPTSPRTIFRAVEDLHALLAARGIEPPFVLTGHSFGGLLVRCYASHYPERVTGLVLVDPLAASEWLNPSEAQWKTLRRGARLARRGAVLARFGLVRLPLALLSGGLQFIPKLVARAASSGSGESAISRLVREVQKMPPETWPIVQAHWCQPKSFLTLASYLESLAESAKQASAGPELSYEIPVTILSASNSTAAQLAERETIANHSIHGRHSIATKSGHWIHFDQPELVIEAIHDMLARNTESKIV
jgi:pimeloyl-ACP methyl ester carboxylesterase